MYRIPRLVEVLALVADEIDVEVPAGSSAAAPSSRSVALGTVTRIAGMDLRLLGAGRRTLRTARSCRPR